MGKQSKGRGKQPSKPEPRASSQSAAPAGNDSPRDPLAAYPADPPRRNLLLLIAAAALFAAWFGYLAYVALGI